ncbi:MAG: GPW/gp25 family protein [bacterium]
MRTYPFYGKGIAFPFRISESTGGVEVTVGLSDSASVGLQFLYEKWTIRNMPDIKHNHIAEAVAHILLTTPTEHDTLPEFGSQIYKVLFEPNTYEFRYLYDVYMKEAIKRWERRVVIPDKEGVLWNVTARAIDMGEAPVFIKMEFSVEQSKGNLVHPFVSDREARAAEYRSSKFDPSGNDIYSRYFGESRYRDGDYVFLRPIRRNSIPYSSSDIIHVVKEGDSWFSIAWKYYKEIRLWYVIAWCYVDDNTRLDRSVMSPMSMPPAGTSIRIPARKSVMMEML